MKKIFVLISFLFFNSLSFADVNKVIIPFSPGGGSHIMFTHLQQYALEKRNITLTPVFLPGADTVIGMNSLAESKPNGLTLGFVTIAALATYKIKEPNYEFDYISMSGKTVMAVVASKQSGITNIVDLEQAIKNPNKETNFGYGSPSQKYSLIQLFDKNNSNPRNLIPYKGAAQLTNDLVGGHIDIAIVPWSVVQSQVESGKLVLIAGTSPEHKTNLYKRYKNWESIDGFAIVFPKDIPPIVHSQWEILMNEYLSDPQTIDDFKKLSIESIKFGPAVLSQHVNQAIKQIK